MHFVIKSRSERGLWPPLESHTQVAAPALPPPSSRAVSLGRARSYLVGAAGLRAVVAETLPQSHMEHAARAQQGLCGLDKYLMDSSLPAPRCTGTLSERERKRKTTFAPLLPGV